MNIAVITGASSGIGREFVCQLDKAHNFDEIWVISRSAGKMSALAELTRAKIRVIALDLTKMESIGEYSALLGEQKPNVTVLVNASGFGRFGAFCDVSLEDQLEMIDLNDKALIAMTYATLPYMPEYSFAFECDLEPRLSNEHTEYKWLTYDEARKLLKWDSNKIAMYEINCQL